MNPLIEQGPQLPRGLGASLPIPLHPDASIDFPSLEKILHRLGKEGIDFVRVGTSEVGVRDGESFNGLLSFVREVLPQTTAMVEILPSTETRDVMRHLNVRHKNEDLHVPAAWLVRPPLSRDVTVAGIVAHFRSIAESTDVPIVAALSGMGVEASGRRRLIESLGEHPNVGAVLLTGGQMLSWPQHAKLQRWASGETSMLPMLAMGCDAVISELAVAFPRKIKEIVDAGAFGSWDLAREKYNQFWPLMQRIDELPSPAGIKTTLSLLSQATDTVRLPHTPLTKSEKDGIYAGLAQLDLVQDLVEPR